MHLYHYRFASRALWFPAGISSVKRCNRHRCRGGLIFFNPIHGICIIWNLGEPVKMVREAEELRVVQANNDVTVAVCNHIILREHFKRTIS